MWALADGAGLDLNSAYAYVLWAHHHWETSLVAETSGGAPDAPEDSSVIAFVLGFRVPQTPATLFVWQIGVSADHRGGGIASRLLDELVARTRCRYVEATLTPSNAASASLFLALARRHDTEVVTSELFGEELFPDGHEPEVRFLIGPLSTESERT